MNRNTRKTNIDFPAQPVLVIDDESQALQSFETALRASGINNILCVQDSREVLPLLSKRPIEVIILDLWMPHLSGEEILPSIIKGHPGIPVIIITGVNEVDTAVRCMKAGAFDYMVKPVEKSRLSNVVLRAIEIQELRRENTQLKRRVLGKVLEHPEAFDGIITQNERMLSVFQYVEAVAKTMAPVMISGETGVGKELVARAIHDVSQLQGPFIPVNAAGVDDAVFSDTLFGHRKGAFTGADASRAGLVEQAAGGTLFLDEIGDLSQQSQIKLLRLLQEREYFPVGGDLSKRSNARIIVATNREINEMQQSESFRRDLYYRLSTHHVDLPALRERLDDLPLLIEHFLGEAARLTGKKKPTPPGELVSLLNTYGFPGNVRELRSMILDAVSNNKSGMLSMERFKQVVFDGKPEGLSDNIRPLPTLISFSEKLPTLKEAEHLIVSEAMKRAKGNQAIAARLLGISRQALNRRIRLENK
ncbi:MAG TPA: sigma-54 dependent transcriptional regulator [Myxococcota bacterium]|nr:sigma-54 dependent transcriptional regulator [Myxococcota bacterium]